MSLCLPRDAAGIRLVRLLTETALSTLTVASAKEIAVALTRGMRERGSPARDSGQYDVTVRIADGYA
jgi:hypothetical protein